jgi:TonB family protein
MVNIRCFSMFVLIFVGVFAASVAPAQEQPGARKIVSKVTAVYPELASKIQIKGIVKLDVVVAPNGKVKVALVVGGSPILAQAAIDAVEKWRWAPAAQETKELVEINFHP